MSIKTYFYNRLETEIPIHITTYIILNSGFLNEIRVGYVCVVTLLFNFECKRKINQALLIIDIVIIIIPYNV